MLGSFSVPNMSLPCETLPGKMQFPFSSLFTVVMLKQKADENGAFGHQWKDSKTHTTDFQRGISNKYPCIVKPSLGVHHITVCCVEFSIIHVGMSDVDECCVHLSEYVHYA